MMEAFVEFGKLFGKEWKRGSNVRSTSAPKNFNRLYRKGLCQPLSAVLGNDS